MSTDHGFQFPCHFNLHSWTNKILVFSKKYSRNLQVGVHYIRTHSYIYIYIYISKIIWALPQSTWFVKWISSCNYIFGEKFARTWCRKKKNWGERKEAREECSRREKKKEMKWRHTAMQMPICTQEWSLSPSQSHQKQGHHIWQHGHHINLSIALEP